MIMDAVDDYARRWIKREVAILLEALSTGTITYLS
jgi:hypothetical protein